MDQNEKKTGIINRNKSCNTCSRVGTVATIHMIQMTDGNHTSRLLTT